MLNKVNIPDKVIRLRSEVRLLLGKKADKIWRNLIELSLTSEIKSDFSNLDFITLSIYGNISLKSERFFSIIIVQKTNKGSE